MGGAGFPRYQWRMCTRFRVPSAISVLVAALLSAVPDMAAGEDLPPLRLPVVCALGADCHIQQYVDRDPGPGAVDFNCGTLTYDAHNGTDFRVPTLRDMERGVPVVAAAPGRVKALRDGMPDVAAAGPDTPGIAGRECGNGVVIDHGGGWETQYCHLRRDSVAVTRGDSVAAGDTLGLIGMSGLAQFPHVHFALRRDGEPVDPFAPDATRCAPGAGQLWLEPIRYDPVGMLDAGFAPAVPALDAIRGGSAAMEEIGPDTPALVVWTYYFGPRAGDVVSFRIDGPGGFAFDHDYVVERDQAEAMRAAGTRRPDGGWPEGTYLATITYERAGYPPETRRLVLPFVPEKPAP